jgi:environmental stress-induced protein Ves
MKFIRYSDLAVSPWKNGLGIRRDIAEGCHQINNQPSRWLASIADVDESTQLSTCPGISRWFMPLSKGWLTLTVEADGTTMPVELTEDSPAHRFSGDASVHCFLHDGPMKTLNIGTENDETIVEISKIPVAKRTNVTLASCPEGSVSFLTVTNGVCKVESDSWSGSVAKWNSLFNDSGQTERFELIPTELTEVVITTIKINNERPEESIDESMQLAQFAE